ncbi:hypothetical protein ACXWOQ_09790, partial [Streptococcus pyogenes]
MSIWYVTEDFKPDPLTVVEQGVIWEARPCVLATPAIKGYLGHDLWTMGVVKENFAPNYNIPSD